MLVVVITPSPTVRAGGVVRQTREAVPASAGRAHPVGRVNASGDGNSCGTPCHGGNNVLELNLMSCVNVDWG